MLIRVCVIDLECDRVGGVPPSDATLPSGQTRGHRTTTGQWSSGQNTLLVPRPNTSVGSDQPLPQHHTAGKQFWFNGANY